MEGAEKKATSNSSDSYSKRMHQSLPQTKRERDWDRETDLIASQECYRDPTHNQNKDRPPVHCELKWTKPASIQTKTHTHKHGLKVEEVWCTADRIKFGFLWLLCSHTLLQSGLVRRETAAKCEAYSDSLFLSNDSLSTESIWRQVSETEREREWKGTRLRGWPQQFCLSQGLAAHSSWPGESLTVTVSKQSWFMILLCSWWFIWLLWLWFTMLQSAQPLL